MASNLIKHYTIDEHILAIELNNPPVNALSKQVREQLYTTIHAIDNSIRAVILHGYPGIFCCGDDIKEAKANLDLGIDHVHNTLLDFGQLMALIEDIPVPTIALIDGWCIGGGLELALCTDIRIASGTAKFKGAGVNIGLMASTYRLSKLIGISKAKEMLLTADVINAEQALNYGLVRSVVPSDALMQEGISLAKLIATKAPLSVKATKQSINNSYDLNKSDNNSINKELLLSLAQTADYKRAIDAHINKVKPEFKGD